MLIRLHLVSNVLVLHSYMVDDQIYRFGNVVAWRADR